MVEVSYNGKLLKRMIEKSCYLSFGRGGDGGSRGRQGKSRNPKYDREEAHRGSREIERQREPQT